MKIFYIITKSEIGGAQTHVYQLSKYFIEKGEEIAVMAYPHGWLELEIKKLGGKFYPNKYLSNSLNPIMALKAMKDIRGAIDDFKPDLVGCHSTMAGILGRIAIRNKIFTIFTAHGWAFSEGVSFWRKHLAILAEKIVANFCSKIICVSEFDKSLALKYKIAHSNKITVIHNGAEIQQLQPCGRFNMKIVFVGRLAKPKDPLLLLQAFNSLSSELQNKCQISIVGEGPKRQELEGFIHGYKLAERVSLLGDVSREKVFEILGKSDIFVLTSNWEGFPYTIIEAMSCGLAIIASDVGGVKEALDEHCGFLIKRGDVQGLKNALKQLLENPLLTKDMGKNAKKRAEKEFSLEKMLIATERVYKLK